MGARIFFRGESPCVVAASAVDVPAGPLVIGRDDAIYVAYKDNKSRIRPASLSDIISGEGANIFQIAYFEHWSIVMP
jgi:hypothetical protein